MTNAEKTSLAAGLRESQTALRQWINRPLNERRNLWIETLVGRTQLENLERMLTSAALLGWNVINCNEALGKIRQLGNNNGFWTMVDDNLTAVIAAAVVAGF